MGLAIPLETLVKTPNKNKTLVGSGVALGEPLTPTTKIGMDRETELNLLVPVYPPGMMTLWTSW